MKKIISVVTSLCIMTFLLAGCGSSQAPSAPAAPADGTPATQGSEAPPPADEVFVINFAHHQQPESPAGLAAQRLADRLIARSEGRLDVRVFPAEQLGNERDIFEQMGEGLIDMSTFGFGIIGSMAPSALAMEMGYMFADFDHLMNFVASDVFDEIVQEAIELAGVRIGAAYYNGVRHTTTSNDIFTDPASLAGVRLRVPNSEMLIATFEAMGSAPTPLAFGEVYLALQTGAIDGQENPIPTIVTMSFYEVQNHLFLTGHMVQAVTFAIGESTYQNLPEDLRQIIIEEMRAEASETSEIILRTEEEQLQFLIDAGLQVHEVDVEAFAEAVWQIIPQFEERWGAGLFDRIQATR